MKVNGTEQLLEKSATLLEYLQEKQFDPLKIAVERNGEIVPRAQYGETILKDTDTLEIVRFVGGG